MFRLEQQRGWSVMLICVAREFKIEIIPQVVNLTLVPVGYLGLPFRLWLNKNSITLIPRWNFSTECYAQEIELKATISRHD